MERRFFDLLKLPRRNSARASDAAEVLYALSEDRRNDAFRPSLYAFQQKFADEEKAQALGETGRWKEFDGMTAIHDDAFETNLQRQERSFLEAESGQEKTFHENEAGREAEFLEGQNRRAATFESCEVSRTKHSEWHAAARETLHTQGRQRSQETCAAIVAALVNQFNRLLKAQEDSFVAAEVRRDSIVKQLAEDRSRLLHDSSTLHESHDSPLDVQPVAENNDSPRSSPDLHPLVTLPNISSTPSSSSTTHDSFEPAASRKLPWITASDDILDIQPTVLPGDLPAASPPSMPPVRNSQTPTQLGPMTMPDSSGTPHGSDGKERARSSRPSIVDDPFEDRFTSAQQERLQTFLEAEKERDSRFQAAEAARDNAEAERDKLFNQKEERGSMKYRAMIKSYEGRFRLRHTAHAQGATRRDEAFNRALKHQSQRFDMSLSELEKQAEAKDKFEEHLMNHRKDMTEALSTRQNVQLEAARNEQTTRFQTAQWHREVELEAPPPAEEEPLANGALYDEEEEAEWEDGVEDEDSIAPSYPSYPPTASMERPPSPVVLRSSSPPVIDVVHSPRGRPSSPAVGFAPFALFGGAGFQDPLPVVGSNGAISESSCQETSFQTSQRRRQLIFSRSQARREDAFERSALRRRQLFSVNEIRRQADFEKKQRARKELFKEKEDSREDDFEEAQREREISFLEAEQGREAAFHRDERDRDTVFQQAQEARAHRYHKTQERLQQRCFEAERRRCSEVETWGTQLLEEREREQAEIYRGEEETREDIFERFLSGCNYVLEGKGDR
ncbi:hypothetical protein LshimejAT787_1203590 [Lyophyllum shimeji]|uniref:Uncharacterized protein n=1 Tax=Lyophyllum shimeji TaxID=47721 RepID=A0A9P3USV1_LYOSH|nr:hypothetical protein LshimejAT787_1203590 [Lyophyllum shimeji]